ncbi:endoplasmic reticulum membrane sensor NFE2L1 isoform X2 [Aplysia californica]|uniref:Endoplasmic reticulum membrane sensor NFE2L1 isoform X2 n=1 Tax=Aplysia californica TaxID=6500 RepID=A0ABM1W491_APLCA|nr:endoplasmic reticulum membrane sensor NFE2L1 isoform X2 [Aplysia californica]
MIKEYFTDGLIGLAILLSLFRTDLTGINNIINYPEVQDIIIGQTAAYLPANFHSPHNSFNVFSNQKHIDFDNEAFSAWYQNIHNLPLFRERSQNEIEAFLVSASGQNIVTEQFQADPPASVDSETNDVPEISSPTLPLESANSYTTDVEVSSTASEEAATAAQNSTTESPPVVVDVSVFFKSPFPGCNLTKEDLDLIDVLWRQDVDLGVGKEVYDQSLRQELEKERELEVVKQQEKQKAQRLAREKEERQKHEQANKWLKQNFTRDGETGEWLRLQNGTVGNNGSVATAPLPVTPDSPTDFMTLEAALDYISASVDPNLLRSLENPEQTANVVDSFGDDFGSSFVADASQHELQETQEQLQSVPQMVPQPESSQNFLEHQDSLEESWSGLVTYLNMAAANSSSGNGTTDGLMGGAASSNNNMATMVAASSPLQDQMNVSSVPSEYDGLGQFDQSDYLLQNATMPSPTVDIANDFNGLTPMAELNASLTSQPSATAVDVDSDIDFDLGDLSFFNNLTTLQNTTSADLDLVQVNDMFMDMPSGEGAAVVSASTSTGVVDAPNTLSEGMDSLQMLEDEFNDSALSLSGSSPRDEFSDAFDGLEGATGGSELSGQHEDLSGPYSKVSRLSESSNDSGFAYQGGFSSSSSTPSSSSSVAGSPASSHHGNSSAASNDTEHDPNGSRALAQHQVAHNHTYNTPPGQLPREVKKYAQKEPARKGPQSRDQRRATEMKVPFTVDDIIEWPVDTFNEMLTKHKLSEAQLNLIRDIRRRGKNKVAAQNCRKRKVGVIVTLADEMLDLQKVRDRLVAERAQMERETRRMRDKFGQLYTHIFQSLRDERGEPYDPNLYSLQQSSDGNVFLVPRNLAANKNSSRTAPASSSSTKDAGSDTNNGSRKRKAFDE